MICGLETL